MSIIRQCRKKLGLSQKALAEFCHVDQTSVSKWELGKSFPDVAVAIQLSSYFGVPLDAIYENPISFGPVSFPVRKHLRLENAAKDPEQADDYLEICAKNLHAFFSGEELLSDKAIREKPAEHFFALGITGNAMAARFCDGDIVLVKKQPLVRNGQIAVVCVDSEEARLFQIKWHKKGIVLQSLNPAFEPVFLTKSECDSGNMLILGLVVELRGKTI
ncbi:MAG: XRE family transcriptional regulator [Eubacteriales bacterium]